MVRWKSVGVVAAACAVAGSLPGAVPASAVTPDDTVAVVAAATPETIAAAAKVATTDRGEIAIDASIAGIDVTVPVDAADGIAIAGEAGSVSLGLPFADRADNAEVQQAGVVSYDNNNGSTTVPVVQNDGSVQVNTVIERASAPTRYAYRVELPEGASIQETSGSLLFVDAEGSLLGGVGSRVGKGRDGR
jgi:hypothetical protein